MALAQRTAHRGAAFRSGTAPPTARGATTVCRCSADRHPHQQQSASRRQLLVATPLLTAAAVMPPATWAEEVAAPAPETTTTSSSSSSATYTDPLDNFSISIPSDWASGEGVLQGNSNFMGASGGRRTLAWFPQDTAASQVNVTLTITNTSVEFTQLGSLGNVYGFASGVVNQMDRSYLLKRKNNKDPVQVAKLIDAEQRQGMYWLEYWVQQQPDPKRHLFSQVAMANNGRYNRLYTVTAQCLEEQLPQYGPVLQQVLASFKPPHPSTRLAP